MRDEGTGVDVGDSYWEVEQHAGERDSFSKAWAPKLNQSSSRALQSSGARYPTDEIV